MLEYDTLRQDDGQELFDGAFDVVDGVVQLLALHQGSEIILALCQVLRLVETRTEERKWSRTDRPEMGSREQLQ